MVRQLKNCLTVFSWGSEKSGIGRRKCQTDEKCRYSKKKYDGRNSFTDIFVFAVQDSFIADIKRNENSDKIQEDIQKCDIFSDNSGINKIGCRNEYKSYDNARYP